MLTRYSGLEGIYFTKILKTLIEVGDLHRRRVLDFGCGVQGLRSLLTHDNYVGYDIDPRLSYVATTEGVQYDIMVVNEVFYEMTPAQISHTLDTIRPPLLLVGIGRKGLLNTLGALLLHSDAHADYKTLPKQEMEILLTRYRILKKKGVWFLADVYLMQRI